MQPGLRAESGAAVEGPAPGAADREGGPLLQLTQPVNGGDRIGTRLQ